MASKKQRSWMRKILFLAASIVLASAGTLVAQETTTTTEKVTTTTVTKTTTATPTPAEETPVSSTSKKNDMAVGLGYGLLHIPIDADLETNGSPVNLFFDFDCIFVDGVKWRVGYNTTRSKMDFDAYNKNWDQEFEAKNIYLSYRGVNKLTENVSLVALVGLDYMSAEVTTAPGGDTTQGSGFGGRIGIATYYYIGGIGLGAQYELNTVNIGFDDVTIDMGGNQLQAVATLKF